MRWKDLKPNFKGKEKKDAKPLKRGCVKRIGLKIRRCDFLFPLTFQSLARVCDLLQRLRALDSFYGQQEGDFELVIRSIAAVKK